MIARYQLVYTWRIVYGPAELNAPRRENYILSTAILYINVWAPTAPAAETSTGGAEYSWNGRAPIPVVGPHHLLV